MLGLIKRYALRMPDRLGLYKNECCMCMHQQSTYIGFEEGLPVREVCINSIYFVVLYFLEYLVQVNIVCIYTTEFIGHFSVAKKMYNQYCMSDRRLTRVGTTMFHFK